MKKVLIGIVVVVVLLVGAVVAIPFLVPVETIKQQVAEQATKATGREFRIDGDASVSVFPRLELKVAGVAFGNAPGAAKQDMATLSELVFALQLGPLLSGEVAIDRLILVEPVAHLEIDESGKPNWQLDIAAPAEPAADSAAGASAPAIDLADIRLDDVGIENGLVTFTDAKAGTSVEISGINMTVSLPSLDGPFGANGELVWNGETISLKLDAASPRALIEGATSAVKAEVSTPPVSLTFDGSVTAAAEAAAAGAINLDVPSIRNLAAWAGAPIDMPGDGLGPLNVAGKLDLAGKKIAFTDAKIGVDGMNATGGVHVDAGGAVPSIRAQLDVDKIDLNTYLPPKPADGGGEAAAGSESGGGAPAKMEPWPDDPIDVSGLKAANAELAFSTGGIFVQDIKVGKSALTVNLKDGKLVAELTEMALYDGNGKGRITVDGSGAVPAITESFSISGIQAEPLLTDAAGFEELSGTGELSIDIATRGKSQRDMVAALDGKGGFKFLDGAIKGINLAAMVRNAANAFLTGDAQEEVKTDFAELSGSFTIAKGVLTNQDLNLQAPLLRVTGAGTSDLLAKTVDYRVEPKAAATLEGQGGQSDVTGLMVPVIVEGPWHDLSYTPDLAGMIGKDIGKALEAGTEGVAKAVEGVATGATEGVSEAVEGVTGGATEGVGKALEGVTGGATEGVGGLLKGVTGGGETAAEGATEAAGGDAAATTEQPAEGGDNPLGAVKKLFGD